MPHTHHNINLNALVLLSARIDLLEHCDRDTQKISCLLRGGTCVRVVHSFVQSAISMCGCDGFLRSCSLARAFSTSIAMSSTPPSLGTRYSWSPICIVDAMMLIGVGARNCTHGQKSSKAKMYMYMFVQVEELIFTRVDRVHLV